MPKSQTPQTLCSVDDSRTLLLWRVDRFDRLTSVYRRFLYKTQDCVSDAYHTYLLTYHTYGIAPLMALCIIMDGHTYGLILL